MVTVIIHVIITVILIVKILDTEVTLVLWFIMAQGIHVLHARLVASKIALT